VKLAITNVSDTLIAIALVVGACNDGGSSQFLSTSVDIGGNRKMYLECDGVGAPMVALIAGKGDRAETWSAVFPEVAGFTRVCAYDRPLTVGANGEPSRSDPVTAPVTAQDSARDLRALLGAAAVSEPYVIVGHSYGGLIARLYASTYPEAVSGLVLEDALTEKLYDGLTAEQVNVFEEINFEPERVDNLRSFAQVTSAPPVRLMPTDILTADLPPISADDIATGSFPPDVTVEFAETLWAAQIVAQIYLASLFPNAKHITKTNSHHYIHVEHPELVIDAIREVVDQVRGGKR
jgi:pimeloyl-ACP methyl ester carboxylesterase